MKTLTHGVAVLVAAIAPVALAAVDKGADDPTGELNLKDALGQFSADLSMPITPAAALVGLAPEQVIQPRTRREFEAGVSNLFNGEGKPVGAIEFLPYYIINGGKLKFTDYRTKFWFRALTKTSLGVATGTPSVDDHALAATAYSLSIVLLDAADPLYHRRHQRCVNQVQVDMKTQFDEEQTQKANAAKAKAAVEEEKKAKPNRAGVAKAPASGSTTTGEGGTSIVLPDASAATSGPLPKKGSETYFTDLETFAYEKSTADYKQCVDTYFGDAQLWNRSRVAIGFVSGSGQEKADAKRHVDFGNTFWLSAQYGFEGWAALRRLMRGDYLDCLDVDCKAAHAPSQLERAGMLTLMARRTVGKSDLDFDAAGEFKRVDSSLYGLRFSFGSDKRSLFLESSMVRDRLQGETRRTRQHAIGASFRYTDNLWINVASGRRKNFVNDKLDSVVSMGVQWGAEPAPLVKPR